MLAVVGLLQTRFGWALFWFYLLLYWNAKVELELEAGAIYNMPLEARNAVVLLIGFGPLLLMVIQRWSRDYWKKGKP